MNHEVWEAINKALKELGLKHEGGGDADLNGENAFMDTYSKEGYTVDIYIKNPS